MRINFYPIRQFDAGAGMAALGAAGPVGLGLAAAQTVLGAVQAIDGGAKAKRFMKQRRAFKTPEEVFKILQATQSIQGGFDSTTLGYLTSTADNATSATLNAAKLLGADPNALSNILDQRIQAGFRIGAENQLENMKNFGKLIGAYGLVADNKAAEQKSQQDIIKDQLQAASAEQQAGLQNIAGGANTALSTFSSAKTASLYGLGDTSSTSSPSISSMATPDYYIDVYNQLQQNRGRRVG